MASHHAKLFNIEFEEHEFDDYADHFPVPVLELVVGTFRHRCWLLKFVVLGELHWQGE